MHKQPVGFALPLIMLVCAALAVVLLAQLQRVHCSAALTTQRYQARLRAQATRFVMRVVAQKVERHFNLFTAALHESLVHTQEFDMSALLDALPPQTTKILQGGLRAQAQLRLLTTIPGEKKKIKGVLVVVMVSSVANNWQRRMRCCIFEHGKTVQVRYLGEE